MSICRRYGVIISGCPDASFTNSLIALLYRLYTSIGVLRRFLRNLFPVIFSKGLPGASVFRGQKLPAGTPFPVRRIDNRYYRNMRYGGLEILSGRSEGVNSKPALSLRLATRHILPMACSNICWTGAQKNAG